MFGVAAMLPASLPIYLKVAAERHEKAHWFADYCIRFEVYILQPYFSHMTYAKTHLLQIDELAA